jgi:hypothetical protein
VALSCKSLAIGPKWPWWFLAYETCPRAVMVTLRIGSTQFGLNHRGEGRSADGQFSAVPTGLEDAVNGTQD